MTLLYSQEAKGQIRSLSPEIKKGLREILEGLREDPYLGKPLQRELSGFWSLVFKQYRVIYKIIPRDNAVRIYMIGRRETVYEEFTKSRSPKD